MLLLPGLSQDHPCPGFSCFLLSFSWPSTFYTSMAFPPFLEKFISGPLSLILLLLLSFPRQPLPRLRLILGFMKAWRRRVSSALCCLIPYCAWPISRPGASTADQLLPLSAAHRHNLYCLVSQPQQKETDQPLCFWSADVLFTSLTKQGEDLMPGIAIPLKKGKFLKRHQKPTCLKNGRAHSFP